MSDTTLIRCDLDFKASGKQSGFLAVPISTNESAYGTLTIPIHVIKHGRGPTVTFTGGVHGDEFEGPVTLMNLARELQPEEIRGRVIIIPSLNLPAVESGTRCSPIDGLNLNRVFPGNAQGNVTEMIAHYVTTELVPLSDLHIDLHSGGKTLEYIPTIFLHNSPRDSEYQKALDLARAFGADITVLEDDSFPDSGRFLTAMFTQAGVMNFSCELAGAGRVSPYVVRTASHGVRNILKEMGMMEGDVISPVMQSRDATTIATVGSGDCYVMAPDHGLYEPFVELGDRINEGQTIGQVHYPAHHDKPTTEVTVNVSGFLLCKRPPGNVGRGDNIAIIAQFAEL